MSLSVPIEDVLLIVETMAESNKLIREVLTVQGEMNITQSERITNLLSMIDILNEKISNLEDNLKMLSNGYAKLFTESQKASNQSQ